MPDSKAIPAGYMTVGELAKRMDVTVRTLQYYDREGLLSPSAMSEGGRRLYTDKDMVLLHQILSLKQLGFSLDDIKNRLVRLDTPAEVAQALAGQADAVRKKRDALSESLRQIEALRAEVLQMQTVDFKKYADIIVNLQMKNEFYWLIKHFDEHMLDHIRGHFDKESGLAFLGEFNRLCGEIVQCEEEGEPPDSPRALALAEAFWKMVSDFTGGDQRILEQLREMGSLDGAGGEWGQQQARANAYIAPALEIYFQRQGIDPFEEGHK